MRKPKYCHEFTDRHGKVRVYFRRHGKRTPLPGVVWSPSFMAAYEAALNDTPTPKPTSRAAPGTVAALAMAFYNTADFAGLALSTKATYRGIVDRFAAEHGARRVDGLTREKVGELLGRKAKTPSAANNWLRCVHMLMQHAITLGWRQDDPTQNVKALKIRSEGFAHWPQELVAQYRAHHALGARARLALELLACTMQRRGDVIRMGRQHVRDGVLTLRQQKTGTTVYIPVLADLRAAIDALPNDHLTFLVTDDGSAFTAAGFGNWFRTMCNAAGVPAGYSAHGLRKAGAIRLAEHGCTVNEIASWGGWKTLKEVERYTKGVSRARVALGVVAKLSGKPTT